jgi:hypothetical protein
VVLAVACAGKPSAPAHPSAPPPPPAPDSGGSAVPVADRSEEQCDKLIAHVVALGAAERPADQKPTDAERAAITAQMRTAWSPQCKQLTSRGFDCALAAQTLAALDTCPG